MRYSIYITYYRKRVDMLKTKESLYTFLSDLFDYATGDKIGPATPEQIAASLDAGDTGAILIDADGTVIADGSWEAQQPGVRTVYVA